MNQLQSYMDDATKWVSEHPQETVIAGSVVIAMLLLSAIGGRR